MTDPSAMLACSPPNDATPYVSHTSRGCPFGPLTCKIIGRIDIATRAFLLKFFWVRETGSEPSRPGVGEPSGGGGRGQQPSSPHGFLFFLKKNGGHIWAIVHFWVSVAWLRCSRVQPPTLWRINRFPSFTSNSPGLSIMTPAPGDFDPRGSLLLVFLVDTALK